MAGEKRTAPAADADDTSQPEAKQARIDATSSQSMQPQRQVVYVVMQGDGTFDPKDVDGTNDTMDSAIIAVCASYKAAVRVLQSVRLAAAEDFGYEPPEMADDEDDEYSEDDELSAMFEVDTENEFELMEEDMGKRSTGWIEKHVLKH